jgi:hypothetical protein
MSYAHQNKLEEHWQEFKNCCIWIVHQMNLRSKDQDRYRFTLEKIAHPLHAHQLIVDLGCLAHALSCEQFQNCTLYIELVDLYLMLLRVFLSPLRVLHFSLDLGQV